MMKYTKEEIVTAAKYTAIGEGLLNDLFERIEELRLERQQNNGKPIVASSKRKSKKPKEKESFFESWSKVIKQL